VTREEISALLTRRRQAVERRDIIALANLYSETGIVESPMAGGSVTGRVAIAELYERWFKAFPDIQQTFEEPLIDGDRVVQTILSAGTDSGEFLGLAPTGKPFNIRVVLVATTKDHQIVHEQRIYDFTGMLVQIGILKAKPA
jgi:predicted ester cyclase